MKVLFITFYTNFLKILQFLLLNIYLKEKKKLIVCNNFLKY